MAALVVAAHVTAEDIADYFSENPEELFDMLASLSQWAVGRNFTRIVEDGFSGSLSHQKGIDLCARLAKHAEKVDL